MRRCARLLTSVPAEQQRRFAQLAGSRGLSSSRLLALMVEAIVTKHASAVSPGTQVQASRSPSQPSTKYTLRLHNDEAVLLEHRAQRRQMQPSSYAAQVLRAHLRNNPPLPYEEFQQIRRLVSELAGARALLIDVTRQAPNSNSCNASTIDAVAKLLPALKSIRDDVHRMLVANAKSWEVLSE